MLQHGTKEGLVDLGSVWWPRPYVATCGLRSYPPAVRLRSEPKSGG